MDDKLSLKGAWSCHVTHFKIFVPLRYLWNGLTYRLHLVCMLIIAYGRQIVPQMGVVTVT